MSAAASDIERRDGDGVEAGPGQPAGAAEDVVGDRHRLLVIGMTAVGVACLVFAVLRLVVTLQSGKLTPWWGNAAGFVAIVGLFLWYRGAPRARTGGAAHGTALVATLALLLPIAYGMHSTIWWLSLVGFAMVLLGRRLEARIWGVAIPLLVVAAAIGERFVQVAGAAGEPLPERVMASVVFVVLLIGMAAAFRRVAEQRAAELHDSEERYRMLFQRVPVGVVHCDLDLRITDCNRRLDSILGSGAERLTGFDLAGLPDPRLMPAIRSALAGAPSTYDGPYRPIGADADVALSVRTVPLHGNDGAVGGALALVEDVTSRVRLEAELRQLKDEFEKRALTGEDLAARRLVRVEHLNSVLLAIRNVNQLIVREKDPARMVQQACELLVETRGYRSAWITLGEPGRPPATIGAAGWAGASEPFVARLRDGWTPSCTQRGLESGKPVLFVDPATACAGCPLAPQYGSAAACWAPLGHEGRVFGHLAVALSDGISADPEEASLLEEVAGDLGYALHSIDVEAVNRRHQELFRASFEGAAVGQALTSLDGQFIQVNSALADILGRPAAELVGARIADVTLADDRHTGLAAATRLRAGSERERFQKRYTKGDGSTVWVDVSVAPVRGADGSPTHLIASVLDISAAKTAEAERQTLHSSLAQSDRLASMGMLAAGVAHEINNPLSYVLYNIESLAEDVPRLAEVMKRCHAALAARVGPEHLAEALGDRDHVFDPAACEDVMERLADALSGTRRIKSITRSLGTFSRVERVALAPVDVPTCVEHAATMASNELKYRARFVTDFARVPSVLASDGKLSQVFLNLFINAAHAIGEGHVEQNELRVRVWPEGGAVLAEVSDTGKGIAPEHRDKIFEPFFTTKGVGVGSGLGLSICKRIVEEFGGTISFTSEVGKGSTFRIRLPELPAGWMPGDAPEPESAPARAPVRGRVLIVDDEDGVRSAVVRTLKGDHEVMTAASGAEARALLEKDRRFDLVLCDLMMPEMSGMELHAWIAEQDAALAARVVFITGGAFTPGAAAYLAQVGNRRIEKPFDAKALRQTTAELVETARSRRPPS